MRILMTVFPEPGHFHAFVGVGQYLESAGHEVVFFCAEDLSSQLRRAGLRAQCFSLKKATKGGENRGVARRSAQYRERLCRPDWARQWYTRVLLTPVAEQVQFLRAVVAETGP